MIEHHFHPADLIGQFIGLVVTLRQARLEPGRRYGLAAGRSLRRPG